MVDEVFGEYCGERLGLEPLLLTLTGDDEYLGRSSRKKRRAVAGAFLNPFAQFKAIRALRKRKKARRAAAAAESESNQEPIPGAVPGTVAPGGGGEAPARDQEQEQSQEPEEQEQEQEQVQEPEAQSGEGVNISTNTILLLSAAVGLFYLIKSGKLKI